MSDASRGSADSYIGSLISLTSKSEIRYEGVLYTVDTANSNIALQDVRSFGTEGRKKDGPQIPPSDKVYDYIIFRATDIKDLQVKRSPPVQTSVNDPAIVSIQTQYSGPALASSFPSPLRGSIDGNFHGSYPNIPPGAFQSNTHSLYPPPGQGSWPAGSENVALPMGWPQYYRPTAGLSNLQQHQPSPLQSQAMLPGLQTSITQQQQQAPPFQLSQQQLFPTLGSMPTPTAQQNFPIMSSAETLVTVSNSIDRALSGLSSSLNTNASTSSILTGLLPEISLPSPHGLGPMRTNSGRLSGDVGPIMSAMQSSQVFGSFQGTSSLSTAAVSLIGHRGMGTSTSPALLAPAHLLQSSVFSASSGQVSSAMVAPSTAEDRLRDSTKAPSPLISISSAASSQQVTTEPLLPLPTAPLGQRRQPNETNGFYANNYQIRRGRGRGRGSGGLQPAPGRGRYNEDRIKFAWVPYANKQFTEDFDFTAMNEKFNKDEVWDELGKGENKNKDVSREELVDNALAELEMGFEQLDDSRKPVYVKDDFFDTLSCDALDREQRNERFDFSERRKIDTETFGSSISRPRNGRGGRIGSYRGGYRGTFQGNQGYRGGNAYRGRFRGVSRTRTDPHQ